MPIVTSLVDALRYLDIDAEVLMNGKWARLDGEHFAVYVVEMSHYRGFFTWCDDPAERSVEYYSDPLDAILSGLRRANQPDGEAVDDER